MVATIYIYISVCMASQLDTATIDLCERWIGGDEQDDSQDDGADDGDIDNFLHGVLYI